MHTFDSFEPGREIGSRELTLDAALVARWCELFPADAACETMPTGMVAIVTSRAYSDVLKPRPPGNVHGAQRFEIGRLPVPGERLVTSVGCRSKEMKSGRRWVTFETTTTDASGEICFRGFQTVLWAA